MKKLYLIGGTMGVGKTSVCKELKNISDKSVFLDGDWCWDMNPFLVTEETKSMVMENICYILNNFIHCSAFENIIFCWVMHEEYIINDIISRLDTKSCDVISISLTASKIELMERLRIDIQKGLRSSDIIERSIGYLNLYEKLNTIKIDTTGKSICEIAKIISEIDNT